MPKKKTPQDLSVDELRWLLMEKRRSFRQDRLERYRKSGRVVRVVPDAETSFMDRWETGDEEPGDTPPVERSGRRRVLDGMLLVVEIAAVVGFLFVLYSGLSVMQELNREVVAAIEQPTLTPVSYTHLTLPTKRIV